jgi:hypothetical protein
MSVFLLPHGIPEQIECTDEIGAKRSCGRCGSVLFNVEPGKGPHYLGLRCAGCKKDYRWLNRGQAEEIKSPRAFFEQVNEVSL